MNCFKKMTRINVTGGVLAFFIFLEAMLDSYKWFSKLLLWATLFLYLAIFFGDARIYKKNKDVLTGESAKKFWWQAILYAFLPWETMIIVAIFRYS